jgi:hypothetical protein
LTFGNPGNEIVLPKDELPKNEKNNGNTMLGTTSAGCRNSSRVERLANAKVWRIAVDVER